MRSIRKFFSLLVLVLGCTGGGGQAADSTGTGIASRTLAVEPSAVIEAERGAILGIRVGMREDSVKGVLGQPLRTRTDAGDSVGGTLLEFPMGTLRLGPRGVVDFLCGGDECRTLEHVGIGDSSDVILDTYGPTPPRGPLEAPEALDYRLGETDCNLTFTLASGRVTSLELLCAVQ